MKKIIILLLTIFITFNLLLAEKFYTDYARFYGDYNMTYTEFYYQIPMSSLKYKKIGDNREAKYELYIKVKNDITKKEYDAKWIKKSIMPKDKNIVLSRKNLIDKKDMILSPGKYSVYTYLKDIYGKKKFEKNYSLILEDQSKNLAFSDIELADYIKEDTTNNIFNRNGLIILPNASHRYAKWKYLLQTYLEIYNVKQDTNKFKLRYYIKNSIGEIIDKQDWRLLDKIGVDMIDWNVHNVLGLKDGDYTLYIEGVDGSDTAYVSKKFFIKTYDINPASLIFRNSDEENEYYHLEYLLAPKDLEYFNSLNLQAKKNYAKYFWLKNDQNPDTPYSEALADFVSKMKYVDTNFKEGNKKGRETDRGRIYLKYGKPDQIVRKGITQLYKPSEIWFYYSAGGITFAFSDITGVGKYILIYSSIVTQRTDPNWTKYIDQLWIIME